jgi:hypothetical protein
MNVLFESCSCAVIGCWFNTLFFFIGAPQKSGTFYVGVVPPSTLSRLSAIWNMLEAHSIKNWQLAKRCMLCCHGTCFNTVQYFCDICPVACFEWLWLLGTGTHWFDWWAWSYSTCRWECIQKKKGITPCIFYVTYLISDYWCWCKISLYPVTKQTLAATYRILYTDLNGKCYRVILVMC